MLKVIFISSFLLLAFISCNKGDITQPYDYERDTPVWLKEKIDSISVNQFYHGAKVLSRVLKNFKNEAEC